MDKTSDHDHPTLIRIETTTITIPIPDMSTWEMDDPQTDQQMAQFSHAIYVVPLTTLQEIAQETKTITT
jgi:hypothetical protein